jgi:hypothetical protein
MNLPEKGQRVCEAFRDGLEAALGGKLFGVYLYGSLAFPETQGMGDIDFHVVLSGPLTDEERSRLYELHDALKRDFPPLGGELDGYYILLADARQREPPRSEMWHRAVDRAWALHRRHIHAGRCVVLHGPDPKGLYPPAAWPEVEEALDWELRYVEDHLDQCPDYCFLQLCRLVYSFQTRDVVVSKAAAAEWGCGAFAEWRRHIEVAKRSYACLSPEDHRLLLEGIPAFYEYARGRIEGARGQGRERRTGAEATTRFGNGPCPAG